MSDLPWTDEQPTLAQDNAMIDLLKERSMLRIRLMQVLNEVDSLPEHIRCGIERALWSEDDE